MLQFVWVFCFCFGFTSLKKFGVQCYPTLAQGQYHNRPVAGCNSLGGTRGWWVNFFWDGTPWGLGLFCKSLGNLKPPTKKKKWDENCKMARVSFCLHDVSGATCRIIQAFEGPQSANLIAATRAPMHIVRCFGPLANNPAVPDSVEFNPGLVSSLSLIKL